MNRRMFLKTIGITLLLSSSILAAEQECQWINIDTQKAPVNEEIVILKYIKDIDPESPRNIANFFVGEIVERVGETAVYMTTKNQFSMVVNRDIDKEDYYRIEKNVNYDEKIEQFIIKYYAKGRCRQNEFYWWMNDKNGIINYKDPRKIRIGFHMINSKNMRTYWTPVNKIPKQLP